MALALSKSACLAFSALSYIAFCSSKNFFWSSLCSLRFFFCVFVVSFNPSLKLFQVFFVSSITLPIPSLTAFTPSLTPSLIISQSRVNTPFKTLPNELNNLIEVPIKFLKNENKAANAVYRPPMAFCK